MAAPTNAIRRYIPGTFPKIGILGAQATNEGLAAALSSVTLFTSDELSKIDEAINLLKQAATAIDTVATPLVDAANDAAAAAAGVQVHGLYRTTGAVKVRLV